MDAKAFKKLRKAVADNQFHSNGLDNYGGSALGVGYNQQMQANNMAYPYPNINSQMQLNRQDIGSDPEEQNVSSTYSDDYTHGNP